MKTIFGVTDPERVTRLRSAVLDFVAVIGGPGFLALRLPELQQVRMQTSAGEAAIELVFDEAYRKQVAVDFIH